MLYDLGPRYFSGGSATASVVVPYLQSRGIKTIDTLVISHSDSDHAGDLGTLLEGLDVNQIVSGEHLETNREYSLCRSGLKWQWQDTVFEFLSPVRQQVKKPGEKLAKNPQSFFAKGNNASCVLKITHGENSLLLTGDIEKSVERRLLKSQTEKLNADVVLVPHHGSHSSSTNAFVKAVDAGLVINSSGYLNRYGFPKDRVVERWLEHSGAFISTHNSGAIEMIIGIQDGDISATSFTRTHRKYWHWRR